MFYKADHSLRKQGIFLKSNHFFLYNICQIFRKQSISVNRTWGQRSNKVCLPERLVKYSFYIGSEPVLYLIRENSEMSYIM